MTASCALTRPRRRRRSPRASVVRTSWARPGAFVITKAGPRPNAIARRVATPTISAITVPLSPAFVRYGMLILTLSGIAASRPRVVV